MADGITLEKHEGRSNWQPAESLQTAPLFIWPPQPVKLLKWLFGFPGFLWPWNALYATSGVLTWMYLTPDLSAIKTFEFHWIAAVFLRNLALIVLVASAWHVPLYVLRRQGTKYKYNGRWPAANSAGFLFCNQLWDNVFWTLISAVPIWTAYEVVTLWAQANGFIPVVSWRVHPLYCTLLLLIALPLFHEAHFYAIHRAIHWPPLYRAVHYLHHKNVNPGPWSGLAMHPVEHLLYFSGVLLFWIIPSHPIHVIVTLQYLAFSPAHGHSGFGKVLFKDKISFDTEVYHHYLHHRYFEVNYGDPMVPLDKWFGTFHDGSEQAQKAMKQRAMDRRTKERE